MNSEGLPNGQGTFNPIFEGKTSGFGCGGVIPLANGNISWLIGSSFEFSGLGIRELTPDGNTVGKEAKVLEKFLSGSCSPVFDSNGFAYMEGLGSSPPSLHRWDTGTWTDLGDTGLSADEGLRQYTIDSSTNDLYLVRDKKVEMVPHTDPLTKQTPTVVLEGISGSTGLALNEGAETMYVTENLSSGSRVAIYHREPVKAPWSLKPMKVDSIRSREAKVHSGLIAGGAQVTYHFEYGTDTNYGSSTPDVTLPLSQFPVSFDAELKNLEIGTTYHIRLVATNSAGTTYGADKAFKTFPIPPGTDPCPNALARKQTGRQRLPDCRAYELVSSHDTGGYDVESYLSPGQTPVRRLPRRRGPADRPLRDPFRPRPGPVESDEPRPRPVRRHPRRERLDDELRRPALGHQPGGRHVLLGPRSRRLGPRDLRLRRRRASAARASAPASKPASRSDCPMAIWSRGWPARSIPGVARAKPEGKVAKMISADGRHLIFASKYAFEPGANNNGTDLTVYDRDLNTGTTQIVSRGTGGAPLTGAGIGELRPLRRRLAGRLRDESLGQRRKRIRPSLHAHRQLDAPASTWRPVRPPASSTPV